VADEGKDPVPTGTDEGEDPVPTGTDDGKIPVPIEETIDEGDED